MKATLMTLMAVLALTCAACKRCDNIKLTREQWKQVSSSYSESLKFAETASQTNYVWKTTLSLAKCLHSSKNQKYVKLRKCIYERPWPKAGFEKPPLRIKK